MARKRALIRALIEQATRASGSDVVESVEAHGDNVEPIFGEWEITKIQPTETRLAEVIPFPKPRS